MLYVVSYSRDLDPRNWSVDNDRRSIDLYLSLALGEPRALTADECAQLLDVIAGWRAQEQRKHMALMEALAALDPDAAVGLLKANVAWWSADHDDSTET